MSAPADVPDKASTPAPQQKWGEFVAGELRGQIVKGELGEGDLLPPESVLLERFGISRPTMREAMRVLEAEGLVTVRRGSHGGVRVAVPRDDVAARYLGLVLQYRRVSLSDVFTAAEALEVPVVGELARTVDERGMALLRSAVDEETAADGPVALLAAQNEFHRLLVELSGDSVLPVVAGMLRHIVDTAADRLVASPERSATERAAAHAGSRAHHRLVELIASGDAEAAEALWRRHLSATAAHVLSDGEMDTVLDLLD